MVEAATICCAEVQAPSGGANGSMILKKGGAAPPGSTAQLARLWHVC
jgi:hypothetical protein